jgi:hypothetical protein
MIISHLLQNILFVLIGMGTVKLSQNEFGTISVNSTRLKIRTEIERGIGCAKTICSEKLSGPEDFPRGLV